MVFHIKTERALRYIELGGFGPGYGVALTPDKKRLYLPLGVPAQSAVAVVGRLPAEHGAAPEVGRLSYRRTRPDFHMLRDTTEVEPPQPSRLDQPGQAL